MYFLNSSRTHLPRIIVSHIVFLVILLQVVSKTVCAAPEIWELDTTLMTVNHHDPVELDPPLTLSKVVDLTMETHPDIALITSLEEEAVAISDRSKSWTAGASQIAVGYQSIWSSKLNYGSANVMVPIWNIGQRDAEDELAKVVAKYAELQGVAIKLRIAGLVREALWNMALAKIRFEQASEDEETTKKLLETIKRRVQLGDLPRADELLAQTEFLQKHSAYILTEAELMHTRKRYSSITRINKVPSNHEEKLVDLKELNENHPALIAINSQIDRKQAEVKAFNAVGSGQSSLIAGILSDEGSDSRSNHSEFFNVGVVVPFGGDVHKKPAVAALNVELSSLTSQRDQLHRSLAQAHHEAEHTLGINKVELENAIQRQSVSEELLSMKTHAFEVGEIDLMDLLKIQSQAQQAILYAKERAVIMKRDIAFYNHAVVNLP